MALMDFIKKQFIDILQWTEDSDGTLAWRFPWPEMEIQNGASLTVRDSQTALFVNEGTVADVFGPGMYKLTTQTLPVLTYPKNWDKLRVALQVGRLFLLDPHPARPEMGHPNPITIRDKDFGIVRLRAFGIYSYRIADPKAFLSENFRYPRDLHPGRTGRPAPQHHGGWHDRPLRRIRRRLHRYGGQPGRVRQGHEGQDGTGLRRLRPGLDSPGGAERFPPEELQKILDQKIGMNMIGDMGKIHQYQVANSIPWRPRTKAAWLVWASASAPGGLLVR